MKKLLILWTLLLPTIAAAKSDNLVEPRFSASMGAWNGGFHQSDSYGHEVNIRTLTSLGLEFAAGILIGPAFIEYNFAWFLSNHTLSPRLDPTTTNDPSNREGPYFSPLGINAGLHLPFIPVEPYIGIEKGTFGFTSGSGTGYSGYAAKLGVNVLINSFFGFRAEYRHLYANSDDSGSLPSDISTSFNCWYIGLLFGKF